MDNSNVKNNQVVYPQFRKYNNNKTYFKIISSDEWEEVQFIGSKAVVNRYKVTIFPDRNYINDLLFDYQNNYLKIEEPEYNRAKEVIDIR